MLALRYGKSKYEAEDILQEGLVQVFKDLYQYDSRKSQFGTWSNRVIVHAALKYLKKCNWHNSLLDITNTEIPHDGEIEVLSTLSAKELTQLIQSLPMGYRIVFNMHVIEGYSHPEIAKKLGIEVGTSKSQLSKSKRELRNKLELQLTKFSNE